MNQPVVSIIIPTYNRSDLLKETLESVLLQTYKNWECILIDDGSTDDTEKIVADLIIIDDRIKYFKRAENYKSGGNGARNYGLDIANGDFINWFDNDDIMLPNFLKDKVEVIKPNHQFIISSHQIVDQNLNLIKSINLEIKHYLFKDYVFWKDNFCIVTNNVLFRKEFLIKNNFRFNENILRGQETELFRKIFINRSSDEYKIINKFGFLYRKHVNSKSKQSHQFNEIFKKNTIDLTLNSLKIASDLNDYELNIHFYKRLFQNLFYAKKNSKYIYYYTLTAINKNFGFSLKWFLTYCFLYIYYYLPSSSRFNTFIIDYFSKYNT